MQGNPDPERISTSHSERNNLNVRMHNRRMTRLTNGFSKKVQNHAYSMALHFLYYNFVRIHQTLKVTPAMAAGVTDRLWEMTDVVDMIEAGKQPLSIIMLKFATLVGTIFLSTPVMGQTLIGPNQETCGKWTHEHQLKSALSLVFQSWIVGYLSGLNTAGVGVLRRPDFLKSTDLYAIVGWIDNYCASHPLDRLDVAAAHLFGALSEKSE